MPPLHVGLGFDPLGRAAIHHAQDPTSLLRLSYDHLDRIRGGAENLPGSQRDNALFMCRWGNNLRETV